MRSSLCTLTSTTGSESVSQASLKHTNHTVVPHVRQRGLDTRSEVLCMILRRLESLTGKFVDVIMVMKLQRRLESQEFRKVFQKGTPGCVA